MFLFSFRFYDSQSGFILTNLLLNVFATNIRVDLGHFLGIIWNSIYNMTALYYSYFPYMFKINFVRITAPFTLNRELLTKINLKKIKSLVEEHSMLWRIVSSLNRSKFVSIDSWMGWIGKMTDYMYFNYVCISRCA